MKRERVRDSREEGPRYVLQQGSLEMSDMPEAQAPSVVVWNVPKRRKTQASTCLFPESGLNKDVKAIHSASTN